MLLLDLYGKTSLSAALFTTNPKYTGSGSNAVHRGWKPQTNSLSYGTAKILWSSLLQLNICETTLYSHHYERIVMKSLSRTHPIVYALPALLHYLALKVVSQTIASQWALPFVLCLTFQNTVLTICAACVNIQISAFWPRSVFMGLL
jgi:hypothetical protein